MHKTRLNLIVIFAAFSASGLAHAASSQAKSSPDVQTLVQIANIARSICPAPATAGTSIGGSVKLGAQGTIPKLVAKFVQVSISAGVRGDAKHWEGVLQSDLAKAQTDSNACAAGVFEHVFDAFTLTNLKTYKPIPRPDRPAATYRAVLSEAGESSTVNIETHAPDSIAAQTINGDVLIEAAREHRERYLKMLKNIYSSGADILTRIRTTPLSDDNGKQIITDYTNWLSQSAIQIGTVMTPSAERSFMNISPPA